AIRLVVAVDACGGPAALEAGAELAAEVGTLEVVLFADAATANVLGDHGSVQVHGAVTGAKEAGRAGGHITALGGEVEGDVVGHRAGLVAQLARQDGAEIRIVDVRLAGPPAHHHAGAAAVVGNARVERANDGRVLEAAGHLGHQLGDVDAGRRGLNRLE